MSSIHYWEDIMESLQKIKKNILWALGGICVVVTLTMAILIALKIVYRYWLNSPIVWDEEFIAIMLVILTYMGAVFGAADDSHIRIAMLETWIQKHSRRAFVIYKTLMNLFICAILTTIAYFGVQLAVLTQNQVTEVMQISYFWLYMIIPVGVILYTTVVAINTIELVRELKK